MRIAVLDDYQNVALSAADWSVLCSDVQVSVFQDHTATVDELVERIYPFEAVVTMRERTHFDAQVLERLDNLRLIVTTGMQNAAIDMDAARARNVIVCGTTGGGSDTAELAWLLISALWREVFGEIRSVKGGGWQVAVGQRLEGATLGLLGLGSLGQRVAAYGLAFGMKVMAWSHNLTPERAASVGVECVSFADLFVKSDIVSIHTRLSDRTRGLVGSAELEFLGPGGYLVNTSRGPIVDEVSLLDALGRGVIRGAALDTFDLEPLPTGHPFRSHPRVLATPHIGYVTRQTYQSMYSQIVENIVQFVHGNHIRVINT